MPQVVTSQHIVKRQKQFGFHMRKWKICIYGVNARNEEEPLPYVDYIEYVLHETFKPPLRKVIEYPFELREMGWGEFDMKIRIHFKDKASPPVTLDHDLNFQHPQYEIPHVLSFKPDVKPSFMKLLSQAPEPSIERETPLSSNDEASEGKANKRQRDTIAKDRSKRLKEDQSSDDDSQQDSSAATSGDEWSEKINIRALAEKFQELSADDLLELVQLIKANQTEDMYVKEDGEAGEFHIDLQTVGDKLLGVLWQFCEKRLSQ
ncbi:hypothetical protein BGW38_005192 [Lunasporangiospora selenospora]|uniref:YEATS domain-containing protein n=1 Tax=Lunasporangiospora selenospora TaxID=979761 RepID=A0A9P6KHG9_9FUNG|nr:hypothetical protein BGW38_005192 [Lunasporangiospora selenospora]